MPPVKHGDSIHHAFVQFGKQHSKTNSDGFRHVRHVSLSSIVLSQQCCEIYLISLTVTKPLRFDYQILQKSHPPNVTSWIRPCCAVIAFTDS